MSAIRWARILDDAGRARWARLADDRALLLGEAPWLGGVPTGEVLPLAGARFAAPVQPRKILCVGRNYRAHAAEMGGEVPAEPLLFMKPATSLLDPGGTVRRPRESARVEHEGELGVVIGAAGRRLPAGRAREHVFGYTVVCDVTARDLQKKDGQWTRAKGFDTFCPAGPWVVSGIDPASLALRVTVNGELRQDGNTADMVFPVEQLVAHASNAMTLEPGDLIATGTPQGVGPLCAGDRVVVAIEQIGELHFVVQDE